MFISSGGAVFYWLDRLQQQNKVTAAQSQVFLRHLLDDTPVEIQDSTEVQFVQAAGLFYRGKLTQFLELKFNFTTSDATLQNEFQFLRGAALCRTGDVTAADAEWAPCLQLEKDLQPLMRKRVQIERCLFDVNRGLKQQAATKLLQFSWQDLPDPFYVTRAFAGVVISLIDLGRFEEADSFLSQEFTYIQRVQSKLFLQGYERLRVLYEMSTEKRFQANERIQSALIQLPQTSLSKAYLLEMLFESQVADGARRDAVRTFSDMRLLRQQMELHKQYYASLENRIDLDLIKKNPRALKLAKRVVSQCKKRGDRYSLARGYIFLGRARVEFGEANPLKPFERALALCERHDYAVIALECLRHHCGSLHKLKQEEAYREKLRHLESESSRYDWNVQRCAANILRSWENGETVAYAEFLNALIRSRWMGLGSCYLDEYDLTADKKISLSTESKSSQLVAEKQFRTQMLFGFTHLWFADEQKLLYFKHRVSHLVDLNTLGKKVGDLARLFFEAKHELSLSEIHAFFSQVPFHPFKHSAALHNLIARLRQFLSTVNIKLNFHNDKYSIARPSNWARIECLHQRGNRTRQLGKRQIVLDTLRSRGLTSTSTLCEVLAIRRQTLHPLLKKLEGEGLIALVSAGPRSGYRLCY